VEDAYREYNQLNVRLYVRMEQQGTHWADFCRILHWGLCSKI